MCFAVCKKSLEKMSDLDEAGVKKLKVAELRAELQSRGLDSKGNKPVLVDRLLEAISNSTVTEANGGEVVQEVADQPQEEAENIEEGSPDEEIQAKSEEPAKEEGDDANQEEETTSETVESVGVASESVEAPAPEPASQVMEEEPSEKHEEMQSETTPTPTEEKVAENEENDKKTQEGEPMETSQDDTITSQETTEGLWSLFHKFFFALDFVINLKASISNHRIACFVVSLTVKHKF